MGKKAEKLTRRSILQTMSASGIAASGVGSVRAIDEPNLDELEILGNGRVRKILNELGNPKIKKQKSRLLSEGRIVELTTSIGELVFGEVGDETGVRFEVNANSRMARREIPREYRNTHRQSNIVLVKDGDNDIAVRQSLEKYEKWHLYRQVRRDHSFREISMEDVLAIYCGNLGGVYFYIISEGETYGYKITPKEGGIKVQKPMTNLSYSEMEIEEIQSLQSDCGGIIFHPCSECVATAAGCSVCASSCVGSLGATCATCILGCGYATNSCCNCLYCIGSPGEEYERCPDDVAP